MKFATLHVCRECSTVVATDASLDTLPASCPSCGYQGPFATPRLSRAAQEAQNKDRSRSGAGPGGAGR